jgi:hypothetical protein
MGSDLGQLDPPAPKDRGRLETRLADAAAGVTSARRRGVAKVKGART